VKKRNIDEENIAKSCMASKKGREMNTERDYISHETDHSEKLDADVNISKIHLISHWAEQIC
jgi:hypothetical protein